ncbi:MAG: hypothetical protein ISR65_09845 [Bacteriovoracaceae bacterium]|nr:hypothetical protein [Bacteriovoracaceae bacterium]
MNNKGQQLSVALLTKDLNETKEISDIFRKTGVIPHFYEDLKSFWYGTIENIPSLCLVDVTKMSAKELLFKNHPHIKTDKMPVVFLYSQQTLPLLYSTFEIAHLGLINKSSNIGGQLKPILKRINSTMDLQNEIEKGQAFKRQTEHQALKYTETMEVFKQREYYNDALKELMKAFASARSASDFFEACSKVFTSLNVIAEYSFLELSENGQKLISQRSSNKKFRRIPSLWLGKTCLQGIEPFAQNMASQVGLDIMGGELMSLMIKGRTELPEKIIFLKVIDEDFLNCFDWHSLENFLSGQNAYFELKNISAPDEIERYISPWKLMDILDESSVKDFKYQSTKSDDHTADEVYLIDIDFSNLIDLARSKFPMRFYWGKFFKEFFGKFIAQYTIDFQIISMGVEHIGILVPQTSGNSLFAGLKVFANNYPYWRYFEDAEIILAKSMKPTVKMVPLSPEAYLKIVEGNVGSPVQQSNIATRANQNTTTATI